MRIPVYPQWGLIASRINSILGLALDFYSVQQTINSSGAVSAVKARCEKEVERIEKQFDDCMAFLLRVYSSVINFFSWSFIRIVSTFLHFHFFAESSFLPKVIKPYTPRVYLVWGSSVYSSHPLTVYAIKSHHFNMSKANFQFASICFQTPKFGKTKLKLNQNLTS